jgi:hypothetical protein
MIDLILYNFSLLLFGEILITSEIDFSHFFAGTKTALIMELKNRKWFKKLQQ